MTISDLFIAAFAFLSQLASGAASLSEWSMTSNGESGNFDWPIINSLSALSLSKSKLTNTCFFPIVFTLAYLNRPGF